MTDDQQVRSLLTLAAELPDDVQAPVAPLLHRARRRRQVRAATSVLAAAVLAAAAFTLPPIIHGLSRGSPGPIRVGGHGKLGPTAAQLARFRWSSLPPSPIGPRSQPLLAWTGRDLIELGGSDRVGTQDDGAEFDLATGRWRRIAPPSGNVGFVNAVDAWTGRELFVTNGQFRSCAGSSGAPADCWPHAGLYDPAANTWSSTKLPRPMYGLDLQSAVWTGRDVVIAGTNINNGSRGVPAKHPFGVAAYNPATRQWRMITPAFPAHHRPSALAMVATPRRVLLWSLWSAVRYSKNNSVVTSGADVLALAHDRWSTVTGNWPQHLTVDSPSYAGGQILIQPSTIWCGPCRPPGLATPPHLADARTLALSAIPRGPLRRAVSGETASAWLWNGASVLAADFNGGTRAAPYGRLRRLTAFDPKSRSWRMLPVPPGLPLAAADPLWADRELLLLTAAGKLLSFHR